MSAQEPYAVLSADELKAWMDSHECVDDIGDYGSDGDFRGQLIYTADGKLYTIYYMIPSHRPSDIEFTREYVKGKGFVGGTPIYEVVRKTRSVAYYELACKQNNRRERSPRAQSEAETAESFSFDEI